MDGLLENMGIANQRFQHVSPSIQRRLTLLIPFPGHVPPIRDLKKNWDVAKSVLKR